MKTICIYHSVDLDGWMSAAIVKKWFMELNPTFSTLNVITDETGSIKPIRNSGINYIEKENEYSDIELHFLGFNYGDKIPDLKDYAKVIMCDISFPKEDMLNINQRLGENFIWIDHHQRTVDEVNQYLLDNGVPMEGSVTEKGELAAACELAWAYFFPDNVMPVIVHLLGRYDCFGHKGTDEEQIVLEFQYGVRQCISNYGDAYKYLNSRTSPEGIISIQERGKYIYQYLCTEAKKTYKKAFPIILEEDTWFESGTIIGKMTDSSWKNRKFLCVNQERFNPINFGIDYHKEGYDGFACFHYANKMYNFSIYNDNGEVACSIIAKQYGGGGHKGASGFRLTQEQFNKLIK